MGPLTTPKKGVEGHCVDPWTPTSNLKILISAASPDIRNREKELTVEEAAEEYSKQDAEEVEEGERMTSRKDKSLGLLCHKFLERFEDFPDPHKDNDISLDDVASELNVERRRIYDIMNVLESLHMVSRSAKNHYTWHGRTKLSQTLFVLKKVGEEQGYHRQMRQLRLRLAEEEERRSGGGAEAQDKENREGSKELFFVELPGVEFRAASVNSRKDKSLRVMSQKFVMLFLVARPRVVSLDIAAQILIGEDQGEASLDKNKFKTKVRRLYDIANVLRSLKLIEKVHVTEERGRKPAFEWVGPEEFTQIKDTEVKAVENTKVLTSRSSKENCAKNLFSNKRFTRHPSLMKLAKSIEEDRRKINSAPSSPAKSAAGDVSVDFPNKMAQLAAICKLQLDHEASGPKPSEPARTPIPLTPATPATPVTPLIPVLLQQQQAVGGGAYAVYVPPPQLRAAARPQPTSLAVRSMTFDSPTALKRPGAEETAESSPSKAQRRETSFRDVSPKLGEILQARLKSRGVHLPSRAAPRALHLDPEFLCPERSPAAEQGVEAFVEREEQSADSEGFTSVRAVPLTPTTIHTETLVPAGYLIPLSHLQSGPKEKPATPTWIYHTPTPGSRPTMCQEFTPTSVHATPQVCT
uniref:Transcription factor E2F8 n=1 Tax=Neogobius melanostomus TaxID=47308 RepID=A0A8C6U5M0_9GOBI